MTAMIRSVLPIALLLADGFCFAQPALTVTAVENGASFTSQITPGGFVTIKGTGFATAPLTATVVPWSTSFGGVSVSVAGTLCPIYYVSPTQINFLLPWKTPVGSYSLIVSANGQTVGPTNINIVSEAPGIFQYGANRAVAQNVNPNNLILNSPSAPAAVGSTIAAYVTGIGLVTNTPADGASSPGPPALSQAVYLNSATIGGVNAPVTFLGLTPGSVGLAQANITVPNLPSGDYPLILNISGVQSTSALISVSGSSSGLPLIFSPLGTVYAPTSPLLVPLQGGAAGVAQVVVSGNYAYLCDANGIAIIDVTNPASPKYLSNFGQTDLNGAGTGCALFQGDLLAFTSALLAVYSLATPTSPQRIGLNQFEYGSRFLSSTTAYISSPTINYGANYQLVGQTGEFYVYNITDPTLPKLDSQLVQNFSEPGSADTSPRFGLTVFNDQTAVVLGTTDTGTTTTGQALWTTIDVSKPSALNVRGQTMIPQANLATNIALQGNMALIAGNTGGVSNPGVVDQATNTVSFPFTGDLTLHTVDFTNPLNGAILGTLVTPYQATKGSSIISLGGGFFSITIAPSLIDLTGPTTLTIVDARNPASLVVYPEYGIDGLQGTTLSNGYLYTVSNAGLTIYSVTLP
jgi:uncharacterized protein (TIGR03437 family)